METITTIDRRTAKARLAKAFPEMEADYFYLNDNKFGLAGNAIAVEFCYCRELFVGKVEIANPDHDSLDYLDSLDSGSEDYDVDPWLTICRGSNCPTLAEAIASLKEAISGHAKAIALVHPAE
jgi:hypothetical protein